MTARPWVQEFPTASGKYVFNHLTGGQVLQGRRCPNRQLPVYLRTFVISVLISGGSALLQPLQPQARSGRVPIRAS